MTEIVLGFVMFLAGGLAGVLVAHKAQARLERIAARERIDHLEGEVARLSTVPPPKVTSVRPVGRKSSFPPPPVSVFRAAGMTPPPPQEYMPNFPRVAPVLDFSEFATLEDDAGAILIEDLPSEQEPETVRRTYPSRAI